MSSVATVRELLERAAGLLDAGDPEQARLDAQLLLAEVLGKPRSWLYAWPEFEPAPAQCESYLSLLAERAEGRPLAYLLGRREFWSLTLEVGPEVLIPRPETEVLVETALALLPEDAALVADLGTGSGAIALALASERPRWTLVATDRSAAALALAARNRDRLGLANVSFARGSWCEALPSAAFSLIVSNPPYIAGDDPHLERGDLRFEPRPALVAADEGLADLALIAREALRYLAPGAALLLEHGWEQGEKVRALLREHGYAHIETRRDAPGHERVTLGRRPGGE